MLNIDKKSLTWSSRIIIFRLFPCKTTWACETKSSGTNGAGTVTRDLPDELLPIITPVLRDCTELCVPLLLRTCVPARNMRARDRANCLEVAVFFELDALLDEDGPPPPPPPLPPPPAPPPPPPPPPSPLMN